MVELFAGISLAFLLYSFLEEWRQRRLNKIHLVEMRQNFRVGRRWDVAKGQWSDNWKAMHDNWLSWSWETRKPTASLCSRGWRRGLDDNIKWENLCPYRRRFCSDGALQRQDGRLDHVLWRLWNEVFTANRFTFRHVPRCDRSNFRMLSGAEI
jgi:hypothetical protein